MKIKSASPPGRKHVLASHEILTADLDLGPCAPNFGDFNSSAAAGFTPTHLERHAVLEQGGNGSRIFLISSIRAGSPIEVRLFVDCCHQTAVLCRVAVRPHDRSNQSPGTCQSEQHNEASDGRASCLREEHSLGHPF